MAEVVDLIDKIKRYYTFTGHEIKGLAITILVFAFVISFKDWGDKTFNLAAGIFNLFNAILIVTLSMLVYDAGKRIWALIIGYRVEYQMWGIGLILSLVIVFLTNGNLWLLLPGGFVVHHMSGHRLGWFRYGINYFGIAMVAFAGSLFTLMLIIFFKILYLLVPNALIQKAIMFNVILVITGLLPIPPLDGSKIYWGSRLMYAFVMPALVAATILMVIKISVLLSLVVSLLVGIILWTAYYVGFEHHAWTGPK